MKTSENTLLFSEFEATTTSQWENAILKDLKGADYEKKLLSPTDDLLNLKPYYRAEDLPENFSIFDINTSPDAHKNGKNDWIVQQDIFDPDLESAAKLAEKSAQNDVNAIGFDATALLCEEDVDHLFRNFDFSKTSFHILKSQNWPLLAEYLSTYFSKKGIQDFKGSFYFDPIGEGIRNKRGTQDLDSIRNLLAKTHNWTHFRPITINISDIPAPFSLQIAMALAIGNEYFHCMTQEGISAPLAQQKIQFTFSIGTDFFGEMSKLRAFRFLWKKIAETYGVSESESSPIIRTTTAKWNLSLLDPQVNLLRSTTQAMSAILGGAHALSILPFDAVTSQPSEFSLHLSRNIQLILRNESYLHQVVDPAAGSYFIENYSAQLAEIAWEKFRDIDKTGGITEPSTFDSLMSEVEAYRDKRKKGVANKKTLLLGVNQYANPQENLIFGPRPSSLFTPEDLSMERGAEAFEQLRYQTHLFESKTGKKPLIMLLPLGDEKMKNARKQFSINFFGCSGYELKLLEGGEDIPTLIRQIQESSPDILVLCSSDEEYVGFTSEIYPELHKYLPELLMVIAGNPKDHLPELKSLGVQLFIHLQCNLLETLQWVQHYVFQKYSIDLS